MNVWVCIGSGPSLASEDIEFCRQQGWNLATCNMGYKVAPDAQIFHAMDHGWWELVGDDCLESLNPKCEVWCGSTLYAWKHKLNLLTWDGKQGYSDQKGFCHGGKLSGLQLINIVGWKRPDLVILLGYDNQHNLAAPEGEQNHWHPDYPEHMRNSGVIDQQSADYAKMCSTSPFPIVNASRETNIQGIPRAEIESIPAVIAAKAETSRPVFVDARGNAIRH